ncbi:MAG: DUF4143 domain-containing protein [Bacilli bacterium]|nr:DUF4143 domain-containing protein [Bacilli bacterium]
MERKISAYLQKWKNDLVRKPLLIYGAKQIGKTFSVLEFGEKEYKNVVYFNTFNNKDLEDLLTKEKSTERIILSLSLISGETILKDDTLIVFDNVDNVEIVKTIKLFGSELSKYHIIMITSKRENISKYKGEELQFKSMFGVDFEEYLWARGEKGLANMIRECFEKRKTCPFHRLALDLFSEYLSTGGMPEVVLANVKGLSEFRIAAIKQKIIDIYKSQCIDSTNLIDIERSVLVYDSIPYQLKKENKKFQYGLLGFGRRKKEFDSAIEYLVANQILYRSYKIADVKSPLSKCKDLDSFKLYLNDEGLLYSMLHLTKKDFMSNENIKKILYENHIAKTLVEASYPLYYYQSEGKAEVDFVIQNRMGKIIPIELATMTNSKAKSLSVFMKRYTVGEAYRVTENNFSTRKDVRYLPIYAIYCLNDLKI